jgi:hypothetical protein
LSRTWRKGEGRLGRLERNARLPMSLPFIKHEEIVADLVNRHEATIRLIAVARIRKYR